MGAAALPAATGGRGRNRTDAAGRRRRARGLRRQAVSQRPPPTKRALAGAGPARSHGRRGGAAFQLDCRRPRAPGQRPGGGGRGAVCARAGAGAHRVRARVVRARCNRTGAYRRGARGAAGHLRGARGAAIHARRRRWRGRPAPRRHRSWIGARAGRGALSAAPCRGADLAGATGGRRNGGAGAIQRACRPAGRGGPAARAVALVAGAGPSDRELGGSAVRQRPVPGAGAERGAARAERRGPARAGGERRGASQDLRDRQNDARERPRADGVPRDHARAAGLAGARGAAVAGRPRCAGR
jgi:hypothetical protein